MFIEHKQLFHWRRSVRNGREIAWCKRLIAGVMLFTAATVIEAAPTGGSVVQPGAATITQTPDGAVTTIDQTAMRVDINWGSFDTAGPSTALPAGESVIFNQPSAAALAVNRISGNRTQFDGTLTANGRIFLINQNGITFGAGSQINVGSLLATTSELESSTSAPETHTFNGDGYGSVVNAGDITVSDGGFAILAAPHVENSGFIKADLGQVELASTNDFTVNVDLRGDGLITFDTNGEWLDGETGELGVTSTDDGILQAKSGHVYLSANVASDIVEGVVNLNGIVDADQFAGTPNGGLEMVASAIDPQGYPGGTIKVESTGDINIGGGTDIHAIGGEMVAASFTADRDITMGEDGNPATIRLKAESTDHAVASLEMTAARNGGAGTLTIADGTIEVTAAATGNTGLDNLQDAGTATISQVNGSGTSAAATVVLEGADVAINADIDVHARAEIPDTGNLYGSGTTDALAVLDVLANGEIEYDTSGNVLDYGEPGDLTMVGAINVSADATAVDAAYSKATANTVLAATGSTDVTGAVNVDASATSEPGQYQSVTAVSGAADANAALVMLGGTPGGLLDLLRLVSLNRIAPLGTLSDMLTLANLDDVLAFFSFVDDPADFLDMLGGVGSGSVSYTGDSNVIALADYSTTGSDTSRSQALAEATAAGYFAAGGDVYINTDPVKVDSQAYANYDNTDNGGTYASASDLSSAYVDTEARSFLVAAAGLEELYGNAPDDTSHSTLTVLGDLSARAQELATLNGAPDPGSYNQLAAALTALIATGDITVRGADPLAAADPAVVQGRSTQWQLCYPHPDQCTAVTDGTHGLSDLVAASTGNGDIGYAHVAQLIIESLYGDIDIQPKRVPSNVQPAGLFTDPIGPSWPGDLPLRFDASGRMLAATGMDATRPPQIVALDRSIETAILAGSDPSTLLPPTASGGCVAAGRDAFTVSSPDYFDRMISTSCETGN